PFGTGSICRRSPPPSSTQPYEGSTSDCAAPAKLRWWLWLPACASSSSSVTPCSEIALGGMPIAVAGVWEVLMGPGRSLPLSPTPSRPLAQASSGPSPHQYFPRPATHGNWRRLDTGTQLLRNVRPARSARGGEHATM